MNIQPISNTYRFGFKSLRTDKKTVSMLKTGEKPVIENSRQNIYAALNNMSKVHDRASIEFLLDVADNLQYGQGKKNQFKSRLDKDGVTPPQRENTDWTKALKSTVRKALKGASDEDVEALTPEFKRIFDKTKKLTPEQQKILDLRKQLTDRLFADDVLQDPETLVRTTNIRKNLDYFVASSEIPFKQKIDSLKNLNYLMSDEYKIVPQLQDKKLQVLDEVLNDITVKAPDDEVLRTKAIDQRQTGMCAAISICRKQMAYEDKTRYTELILDELRDSDVMSVYDVTDLASGKKIEIQKVDVDYDTALNRGYRIVDAAAHIWMNNAHASGDGSLQTEHYIPYSSDCYGIFDDASWYTGLDVEEPEKKLLLMCLIKENEFLKSLKNTKKNMHEAALGIRTAKNEAAEYQGTALDALTGILQEVFPDKNKREVEKISSALIEYYNGNPENGGEINIPGQYPDELKQQAIVDFVVSSQDEISDENKKLLKQKAPSVLQMINEYNSYDEKIQSLKRFSTPSGKFAYNKKLYRLAAAHRMALETDINLSDGVIRYEKSAGLPTRRVQIANYMNNLTENADSEALRASFADENGNIPDVKTFKRQLKRDNLNLTVNIPAQINLTIKKLTGNEFGTVMAGMFESFANEVASGDKNSQENIALAMGIKNDKTAVVKFLQKQRDILSDNPSGDDIAEAVRLLGYEDETQLAAVIINSFLDSLSQGISEQEYYRLADTFGGEGFMMNEIKNVSKKYNKLIQKREELIQKYNIPTVRALIMEQYEKNNEVLTSAQLDKLKAKFDEIDRQRAQNDSIKDVKERKKANEALYRFSNEETEIFDRIEKSLPSIKKYCKTSYKSINDELKNEIEEQYARLGMLTGQFWVREEGSSGLAGTEQLRIIEQMTGKPHHLEFDVQKGVEEIKKGNGSGIISMSVLHDDYGFHAQYIPGVTTERITEPVTGKKSKKDVIWTDNSWGRIEKEHYWDGKDGFLHTDYGNGYGWQNGFMINDDYRIGLPLEEVDGAVGSKDGEKFGLFSDMVLPGTPVSTYQKLYKMFNYIFTVDSGTELYRQLEKAITDGGRKIDAEYLSGLDKLVEQKTLAIEKRVDDEIRTREDFDKLPKSDEVKFTFEKLAMYLATDNPECREEVLSAMNSKELNAVYEKILEVQANLFGTIMAKTDDAVEHLADAVQNELVEMLDEIDQKYSLSMDDQAVTDMFNSIFYDKERVNNLKGSLRELEGYFMEGVESASAQYISNPEASAEFTDRAKEIIAKGIDSELRINSLESVALSNSPVKSKFIAAVDRVFNPDSDEKLLEIIQTLQEADYDVVNNFIDKLTDKELGIDVRPSYEYVKKYKEGNTQVNRALNEVIATNVLSDKIDTSGDPENQTPDELYRSLFVKLSELDVQRFIKAFKAEAFQKYNVRSAFPQPVVLPEDDLINTAVEFTAKVKETCDIVKNNKKVIDFLNGVNSLQSKVESSSLYNALKNGEDIEITEENYAEIDEISEKAAELYLTIKDDTTTPEPAQFLGKAILELQNETGVISGAEVHKNLSGLFNLVSVWQKTSLNINHLEQSNKEYLSNMKINILSTIEANIEPKYRNDALNLLNKLTDLCRTDGSDTEIYSVMNEFCGLFARRHIVKNPPELLKECVRLAQNGQKDSQSYDVMCRYLEKALSVAEQTKLQYKLVQNQHEGISSKVKEMLSMFNVKLNDGTSKSLDSDTGMLYLIERLNNAGDNNATLNLFLNQTGLAKQAVSAVTENFDKAKCTGIIDTETENVAKLIDNMNELYNLCNEFIGKSKIKYSSLEDFCKHICDYISRKYKGNENIIEQSFINYMSALKFTKESETSDTETILSYFDILKIEALQYILDVQINSKIKYIIEVGKMTADRVNLAYSIDIPEKSDENTKRENFRTAYEELAEHLRDKTDEIQKIIDGCAFLNSASD